MLAAFAMLSAAARTSAALIKLPFDAATMPRSIPFSAASFLAFGIAGKATATGLPFGMGSVTGTDASFSSVFAAMTGTKSSSSSSAGAETAAAGAAGAGASSVFAQDFAASRSAASPMVSSSVPASTLSNSFTHISVTNPLAKLSMGSTALSVSTSISTSPLRTASPTATWSFVTVATSVV